MIVGTTLYCIFSLVHYSYLIGRYVSRAARGYLKIINPFCFVQLITCCLTRGSKTIQRTRRRRRRRSKQKDIRSIHYQNGSSQDAAHVTGGEGPMEAVSDRFTDDLKVDLAVSPAEIKVEAEDAEGGLVVEGISAEIKQIEQPKKRRKRQKKEVMENPWIEWKKASVYRKEMKERKINKVGLQFTDQFAGTSTTSKQVDGGQALIEKEVGSTQNSLTDNKSGSMKSNGDGPFTSDVCVTHITAENPHKATEETILREPVPRLQTADQNPWKVAREVDLCNDKHAEGIKVPSWEFPNGKQHHHPRAAYRITPNLCTSSSVNHTSSAEWKVPVTYKKSLGHKKKTFKKPGSSPCNATASHFAVNITSIITSGSDKNLENHITKGQDLSPVTTIETPAMNVSVTEDVCTTPQTDAENITSIITPGSDNNLEDHITKGQDLSPHTTIETPAVEVSVTEDVFTTPQTDAVNITSIKTPGSDNNLEDHITKGQDLSPGTIIETPAVEVSVTEDVCTTPQTEDVNITSIITSGSDNNLEDHITKGQDLSPDTKIEIPAVEVSEPDCVLKSPDYTLSKSDATNTTLSETDTILEAENIDKQDLTSETTIKKSTKGVPKLPTSADALKEIASPSFKREEVKPSFQVIPKVEESVPSELKTAPTFSNNPQESEGDMQSEVQAATESSTAISTDSGLNKKQLKWLARRQRQKAKKRAAKEAEKVKADVQILPVTTTMANNTDIPKQTTAVEALKEIAFPSTKGNGVILICQAIPTIEESLPSERKSAPTFSNNSQEREGDMQSEVQDATESPTALSTDSGLNKKQLKWLARRQRQKAKKRAAKEEENAKPLIGNTEAVKETVPTSSGIKDPIPTSEMVTDEVMRTSQDEHEPRDVEVIPQPSDVLDVSRQNISSLSPSAGPLTTNTPSPSECDLDQTTISLEERRRLAKIGRRKRAKARKLATKEAGMIKTHTGNTEASKEVSLLSPRTASVTPDETTILVNILQNETEANHSAVIEDAEIPTNLSKPDEPLISSSVEAYEAEIDEVTVKEIHSSSDVTSTALPAEMTIADEPELKYAEISASSKVSNNIYIPSELPSTTSEVNINSKSDTSSQNTIRANPTSVNLDVSAEGTTSDGVSHPPSLEVKISSDSPQSTTLCDRHTPDIDGNRGASSVSCDSVLNSPESVTFHDTFRLFEADKKDIPEPAHSNQTSPRSDVPSSTGHDCNETISPEERRRLAKRGRRKRAKARKQASQAVEKAATKNIKEAIPSHTSRATPSSSEGIILNFDDNSEFKIDWEAEMAKPFYITTEMHPPRVPIPKWAEWDFSKNYCNQQKTSENQQKTLKTTNDCSSSSTLKYYDT